MEWGRNGCRCLGVQISNLSVSQSASEWLSEWWYVITKIKSLNAYFNIVLLVEWNKISLWGKVFSTKVKFEQGFCHAKFYLSPFHPDRVVSINLWLPELVTMRPGQWPDQPKDRRSKDSETEKFMIGQCGPVMGIISMADVKNACQLFSAACLTDSVFGRMIPVWRLSLCQD